MGTGGLWPDFIRFNQTPRSLGRVGAVQQGPATLGLLGVRKKANALTEETTGDFVVLELQPMASNKSVKAPKQRSLSPESRDSGCWKSLKISKTSAAKVGSGTQELI